MDMNYEKAIMEVVYLEGSVATTLIESNSNAGGGDGEKWGS